MEQQLDFSAGQSYDLIQIDNAWPSNEPYESDEVFELPEQLGFSSAVPPILAQEKPQPMAFTNKPKIVKFATGQPKKKQTRPMSAKPRPKPAVGRGGPPARGKKPAPAVVKPKRALPSSTSGGGGWNSDNKSSGLFDTGISKKIPLDIKLAMNEQRKNMVSTVSASRTPQAKTQPRAKTTAAVRKPDVFQELKDLPIKDSMKQPGGKQASGPAQNLPDNLDFNFILDQEQVISRLNEQLKAERVERKKADANYAKQMRQLEQQKKLDAQIEKAKAEYLKRSSSAKAAQRKPEILTVPARVKRAPLPTEDRSRSTGPQRPVSGSELQTQIEIMKENLGSGQVIHDRNGGDIYEQPTKERAAPPAARVKQAPVKPAFTEVKQIVAASATPERLVKPSSQKVEVATDELERKFNPILEKMNLMMDKFGQQMQAPQVSDKLIRFYADELSRLMLEEVLEDTVHNLQRIELAQEAYETKTMAENTVEVVEDLQTAYNDKVSEVRQKLEKKEYKVVVEDLVIPELPIVIEDDRREWAIHLTNEQISSITSYKERYSRAMEVSDSSNLWEMYQTLSDAYLEEIFCGIVKNFDDHISEYAGTVFEKEFV